MAKDKNLDPEEARRAAVARYRSSDSDIGKAKKWFARAAELADQKNLDFAIKCYWDGLNYWPEAVEEAHRPLRATACFRNLNGGKKPGFGDSMKFSMTGRDALKAMLNAEWLLSHDPFNVSYMEGVLKNANKLHAEDTVMWIAPIYKNAIEGEKKLNPKRFALLREVYEEAGDRVAERGEGALAVQCFDAAGEALRIQKQLEPKNGTLQNELRDLSTKLTILKGKYETATTFQESIRDADQQRDIHDKDRLIQSDDNIDRLVAKAERDLAGDPGNVNKVNHLVELLCRNEHEADEKRAIALLVGKYKDHGDYRFKQFAEDIHAKQLRRAYRLARDDGDPDRARQLLKELLAFEIKMYRERIKQYPTDNRIKYEYAQRLFQARMYDEAIPQFQLARADSKVRMTCDLHLGRCFYEKGFFAQAIGTLTKAVEAYEIPDDIVGKELRYWLGRSLEADKRSDQAAATYGQILELDYNFRDVRDRLSALQST